MKYPTSLTISCGVHFMPGKQIARSISGFAGDVSGTGVAQVWVKMARRARW